MMGGIKKYHGVEEQFMHCPRCGTELTTISIDGGSTAVYCDQCGFANIETSPASVEPESETWDDALKRFHDTAADTSTDTDAEDVQKKQNASMRPDDNFTMDTNSHSRSDPGSDQPSEDANDDDGDRDNGDHTDNSSTN